MNRTVANPVLTLVNTRNQTNIVMSLLFNYSDSGVLKFQREIPNKIWHKGSHVQCRFHQTLLGLCTYTFDFAASDVACSLIIISNKGLIIVSHGPQTCIAA